MTINVSSGANKKVIIYITGDFNMSGDKLTINANNPVIFYISGNVKLRGGAQIVIKGPDQPDKVKFYVNGSSWSSDGGDITNDGLPGNLYISLTRPGSSLDISTATSAHLYAPLSDITFHGNAQNPPADFKGWVIGKTLNTVGNCELHYDESLNIPGHPLHASLVK